MIRIEHQKLPKVIKSLILLIFTVALPTILIGIASKAKFINQIFDPKFSDLMKNNKLLFGFLIAAFSILILYYTYSAI